MFGQKCVQIFALRRSIKYFLDIWSPVNQNLTAFFLFILCNIVVSCSNDDRVEPKAEYPKTQDYIGDFWQLSLYSGDTTDYTVGLDTITVKIRQDSILLNGSTYNYVFKNIGNEDSAQYSRYISAAGGTFRQEFRVKEDSLFVYSSIGNSFRYKYTFIGKKL